MTNLAPVFERLGLRQYLETFVDEGFDTWETVLYITESDLDALNVKLGHRRKLQKEIANARGVPVEQIIGAGARNALVDESQQADPDARPNMNHIEGRATASGPSKRKYRRHPKADENAPERAPSAYVIFSNKIREELRPHKLSFTEIAKTVGERWQELGTEEKEPYEAQAAAAKELYNAELAKYKRTSQYRDYTRYLNDFKARNAPNTTEGKRLKLETELSNASSASGSGNGSNKLHRETSNPDRHTRKDSLSQSGYSPSNSSIPSPSSSMPRFVNPIESTHGSHPSTPVTAHAKQPGAGHPGQVQRGFEPSRTQHLPRILPLESRESSISHRIPFLSEQSSSVASNPRRSGTNSPTAFLRHDTSKSSTSSNISGVSGGSASYTPITPVEDSRPARSLPLPPPLLAKSATTGTSITDLTRAPVGSGLPPKIAGQYGSSAPTPPGYANSFHHLSLRGESSEADERLSRSTSTRGEHQSHPLLRSASSHHSFPPTPHNSSFLRSGRDVNTQDHTSRLNSLSVLALAGQMMDNQSRDPKDRPER